MDLPSSALLPPFRNTQQAISHTTAVISYTVLGTVWGLSIHHGAAGSRTAQHTLLTGVSEGKLGSSSRVTNHILP